MIHGHGGNIFDAARKLGCRPDQILDMSSNFNPLGPPPGVVEMLRSSLTAINRLPEVDAGRLTEQYAQLHGRLPAEILVGGGTTQFIYQLPRALESRRALICGPTYADYRDACAQNGVDFSISMASEQADFQHDREQFWADAREADLIFICNPNNPTGGLWQEGEIERLARAHPNKWIVVDESYLPMALQGDGLSQISKVPGELPNVIVLDSCSKIYRIPGLRIGFLIAAQQVIDKLRALAMPWSVNGLAQEAGRYLIQNHQDLTQFVDQTRRYLAEERDFIADGLAEVEGLKIYPSHTSYLLLRLPRPHTSVEIMGKMLGERILIRDCANFKGLSDRFVRVSLKDHSSNAKFVHIFRKVLQTPLP